MFDLYKITDPSFVKDLSNKELKILAQEIREFLIDNVSKTGGHLASNLGIVEITIALHYVFDSPTDKLLFDVGHQSYVHKILTGRASEFHSLRKFNGLSGYIKREESVHDCFESGHSSTSIATSLGMLYADSNRNVVSIIGDSSIANGIAFEALNITHEIKQNPIVILNDNKMGISKSVGALNSNLNKIRGTKFYRGVKKIIRTIFPNFFVNFLRKINRGIKGFLQVANIFEDMGYDYYGPYNGNDIKDVISSMQRAKKSNKPVLIHLITEKGKGYHLAEDDEDGCFHGVSSFNPNLGISKNETDDSFSESFATSLIKLRKDFEFSVINPAMISGTKLNLFQELYPNDVMDVGIAEEFAVAMATGIALENKDVVLSMYSTFAQRSYDYFLNDIARQNLKVLVCLDRAGIVGPDGSTHQGVYDVSMFNSMPNFKIAMPINDTETYNLMKYYFNQNSPMVIRYPKAIATKTQTKDITDESWYYLLNNNSETLVISYGPDLQRISDIVNENNLNVDILNALFIKPLDLTTIKSLNKYKNILIYEQIVKTNSLGSNVIYELSQLKYQINIKHMCLNVDDFLVHGDINSVLDKYNLGNNDILKEIKKLCD